MLGVAKKNGINNRSLLSDEFCIVLRSLSALIKFMVHIPFEITPPPLDIDF
jgi:hypothetical protein